MLVLITGISRGLGLALAKNYLASGHVVVGIGRSSRLVHPNFQFIPCDLSDWQAVETLEFSLPPTSEILLINNAGILEPVKRISDQTSDHSGKIFQVNTIAPIQLIRKLSRYADKKATLTILNISSGAGRRAIPSWANYGASKAALDSFSQTFQLEEIEKGKATRIYSLAPGVIDTDMQKQIRKTAKKDFSASEQFHQLHKESKLMPVEQTAAKIVEALQKNSFQEVLCRF